ncbi:MAG: glycosyltransferase [Lachnospiraceae bacterium]|nr:glycosyltransferase [Lachnospiraceae bacterium]
MDKISVIVPVYNVENYIDKCVESIVNQTYSNLEIILVDDGAIDSSGKKCDEWAKKDARITVIHKENGGLSDARNAGLKIATGDYIGFVDSDDWIDTTMYERLYKELSDGKTNIALCEFLETETEDVKGEKTGKKYEFTGRELLQHMFEGNLEPYVTYSVWKCLYRKEAIEELTFPKGRVYEDVLFTAKAFWEQARIVVLADKLYYYRVRRESITKRGFNRKQVEDILAYCDGLLEFYKENGTEVEKQYLNEAILWTVLSFRYDVLNNSKDDSLATLLKDYLRRNSIGFFSVLRKDIKKRIKYTVWNGPKFGCRVMQAVTSIVKGQ